MTGSMLPTGDPELVGNDNSDASSAMIEFPICFSGNELTIDSESEAKQWVPAQAPYLAWCVYSTLPIQAFLMRPNDTASTYHND